MKFCPRDAHLISFSPKRVRSFVDLVVGGGGGRGGGEMDRNATLAQGRDALPPSLPISSTQGGTVSRRRADEGRRDDADVVLFITPLFFRALYA